MPVINRIADFHDDMTAWRRDIHAHPETAFEENRTAEVVADKLESFGIEVHRGMAKTGVVGRLRAGASGRTIGLRRRSRRPQPPGKERVRLPLEARGQDARLRP